MIEAPTKIEPALLTVEQTCQLINVGRAELYRLRATGAFAPLPVGLCRKVLYRKTEIENWIQAGCPHRKQVGKMNYQDVKTFQELAEAIKEHIDSHRIPCTDVLRGEGVLYVNAKKLSTTDARLAFIRLKNKFSVELPVPDDLIELLDSCEIADRKLQDKSEPEKTAGTGQNAIINVHMVNVQAKNLQIGHDASIHEQQIIKESIIVRLLKIVGAIIVGTIGSLIAAILFQYFW